MHLPMAPSSGRIGFRGLGASLLIFVNIVSALPGSIGAALQQAREAGNLRCDPPHLMSLGGKATVWM
jgi:hypothetical protein